MMNKKSIKNLNRKTKVYAGIILFFLVSVFIRIGLVQRGRGRAIVSFVSEWAQNGKPVTVAEIKATNIPVYTKLSVRCVSGKRAAGFVTGDIKDKLKPGQEVFTDKIKPCGMIVAISGELDTDTGMFPVEIELNAALGPGELVVVTVHTDTLPNALVVPNEVLDFSGGEYYLWKVENKKAKRVKVTLGSRNGYGTLISEGINSGDLIVFSGRSILSENDKVRIICDEASRLINAKGRSL
ncbi:MAG: hypothetical protein PHQ96_03260 [Candidatus Omnitrophica bacterium]|nr:hypothetical protein [Candidatus Omnitrophota bacterium]